MKPIIFNSEMVRAILEGRKTQTRRAVKRRNINPDAYGEPDWDEAWIDDSYDVPCLKVEYGGETVWRHFPKYSVGDILWVRETFWYCCDGCKSAVYKADNPEMFKEKTFQIGAQTLVRANAKWKPSIHMPLWAARIFLKVTKVRAERVQDITCGGSMFRSDVQKEGCPFDNDPAKLGDDEIEWFSALWDSINKKRGYGWEVNPWVWVYDFKRIQNEVHKDRP